MTTLSNRVAALEANAEERAIRTLATHRSLAFERLLSACRAEQAESAALMAAGRTWDEVVELKAARLGVTPAELRRHASEIRVELQERAARSQRR